MNAVTTGSDQARAAPARAREVSKRVSANGGPRGLTISRYSRCSAVSSVSSANSVTAMIPFIGVRSSCVMFASNSDLAVASAAALTSRMIHHPFSVRLY